MSPLNETGSSAVGPVSVLSIQDLRTPVSKPTDHSNKVFILSRSSNMDNGKGAMRRQGALFPHAFTVLGVPHACPKDTLATAQFYCTAHE